MWPWSTTGRAGWPTPSRACCGSTRRSVIRWCSWCRGGTGWLIRRSRWTCGRCGRRGGGWGAPPGEPSGQAVAPLLARAGGAPPVPWEFEGLGTILSLVARGIGIAAVPRLALAAGEARVVVRALPEGSPAREVYAVARAASVRRPSVAVILTALHDGAKHLPGRSGGART